MDVKNESFWSQIRSRFGELCGTPPPRKSRSTPNPPLDTAAQIALKLIRRKRNQHQISIFIYLFIYLF